MIERVISGGQTGVDRGALDAAIEAGVAHGGWCPLGRRAEDGPIPSRYLLLETITDDYPERTERNVLDSDGTLILYRGKLQGGTKLTHRLARRHARPVILMDMDQSLGATIVEPWMAEHEIRKLNVAGPRESNESGIQAQAKQFMLALLRSLNSESA